jgi:hypothetical protein
MKPLKIPPILLEGDEPAPAPVTGPGEKFALGGSVRTARVEAAEGELPEAYGTGRLFLAARDPHSLYAHWDFTAEQQRGQIARAKDHRLALRLYVETLAGPPAMETPVPIDSRHCFVRVERAGATYVAELGYYLPEGPWQAIAASETAAAPRETIAQETEVQFATMAGEAGENPELSGPQQGKVTPAPPVKSVTAALPFPLGKGVTAPEESEVSPIETQVEMLVQTKTLLATPKPSLEKDVSAELTAPGRPPSRHESLGLAEGLELIRRRLESAVSALLASQRESATSPGAGFAITSPMGEFAAEGRGFWLKVNADLIVYGATERDASVTLGGQRISLRPDGTFSFRFALPEGSFQVPVIAVSTQGDVRQAELQFSRATRCDREVGAHPQDPESGSDSRQLA